MAAAQAGLAREVERLVQEALARFLFRAKVVGSTATSCTVERWTGDTQIVCGVLESYVSDGPAVNEEVWVVYHGGGHVVLGRVLHP